MYNKQNSLTFFKSTAISLSFLIIALVFSSCDLFFKKELRQDQKLTYYKHRTTVINDSIKTSKNRVKAYKELIATISEDKHLITPRKKNMLLSEVYSNLGVEYYDTYKLDDAVESNNIAIMLDINNQNAYYNRACLYQMLGEDSLAIEDYTKTISYDSNYTNAYYNRAILYESKAEFQLAVEDYSNAIKLSPPYIAEIYNNRGNAYLELDLPGKAIEDYNTALSKDSTMATVYCNRAAAYMKIGEEDKALRDYKMAMQIDSSNQQILDKINEFDLNLD